MATLFLLNPRSGGGAGARLLDLLARSARDFFPAAQIEDIIAADSASLIEDARFERIVIVGGDGTFASVLPQALSSQKLFGILPLGTGNDLAKELRVYRALSASTLPGALKALSDCGERRMDVWKLEDETGNSRLFCNYCSLGLDAEILRSFEAMRARAGECGGRAALFRNRFFYVLAGLLHLSYKLPPLGISGRGISRRVENARTLLFPNIRSYLGLGSSCRGASPFDGRIPAVEISNIWAYAGTVLRGTVLRGDRADCGSEEWKLELGAADAAVQCDGEMLGSYRGSLRIAMAGSIRVLCGI